MNANQDKCNSISSPVNTCFMTIVGFGFLVFFFCFVGKKKSHRVFVNIIVLSKFEISESF